jgi:hypothetical protein
VCEGVRAGWLDAGLVAEGPHGGAGASGASTPSPELKVRPRISGPMSTSADCSCCLSTCWRLGSSMFCRDDVLQIIRL